MKKTILLVSALFIGAITAQAQEKSFPVTFINLESGINLSQFDFSDTETTAFENGSYSPAQHQALSLGFNLKDGLSFVLGAAYDKHELIGKSLDISNTHLSYSLNYVSARIGLEYDLPLRKNLSLLVSGGLAYNYLLSGFQNMGAATYDLSATDFEENSYTYNFGAALLYQVNDAAGVYLKYDWSNTLDMQESTTEAYDLSTFILSAGIRFNLTN